MWTVGSWGLPLEGSALESEVLKASEGESGSWGAACSGPCWEARAGLTINRRMASGPTPDGTPRAPLMSKPTIACRPGAEAEIPAASIHVRL